MRSRASSRALVPLTPEQAQVLLEAGHVWMALGRWQRALEVFEGVCVLLPALELPWLGLGLLAQAQGRFAEALAHFKQAQGRAPRAALVRLHVAEVLTQLGRHAEAEQEYKSAERLEPESPAAEAARTRARHLASLANAGR